MMNAEFADILYRIVVLLSDGKGRGLEDITKALGEEDWFPTAYALAELIQQGTVEKVELTYYIHSRLL